VADLSGIAIGLGCASDLLHGGAPRLRGHMWRMDITQEAVGEESGRTEVLCRRRRNADPQARHPSYRAPSQLRKYEGAISIR
jgi:hypothetical protein